MNKPVPQFPEAQRIRFEELEEFPNYAVGENGEFVNMKTGGMPIHLSRNSQGLPKITLIKDGLPSTRSPARLVAETFVEKEREDFDTVIHLNNDRMDCQAQNLRWRPRWFAIAFHKQFYREAMHQDHTAIQDLAGEMCFASPKDAVMSLGILYNDIVLSFTNDSYTFPTMQKWTPVH